MLQSVHPKFALCRWSVSNVIVFPNTIVNGCLFHFKQVIQRKLIDLQFQEDVVERMMYENTLEVLTLINLSEIKCKGIPYVRSIINGDLRNEDLVKMENFWKYFENFWMKSPAFIATWNIYGHYNVEKMKLQRTNNGLERYNKTLNEKFKGKQSLLSFIKILEEEARFQESKLEDIRRGNLVNKRRRDDKNDKADNERQLKVPSFYYDFNP